MKFYIFTGDESRNGVIFALAGRLPGAESVCALPGESSSRGTCTVTSLSVLESGKKLHRTEYALVLYGDSAYLGSGKHRELSVEYGDKYTALSLPLSVGALAETLGKVVLGEVPEEEEKPQLFYDRGARTLSYMGKTESLTKLESQLYELFRERGDSPLSKEEIRHRLWEDKCKSNAPDVYVSYLRRKLDRLFGEGSIVSVRGVGYKLK